LRKKLQTSSSKLQRNTNTQAPKTVEISASGLKLDVWIFSGAWDLEFEAFPLVPEVGIAPTSPRLQRGANLPQLLGGKRNSKHQSPNTREAPISKLQNFSNANDTIEV
jgi:hypothetical protein